MRKCKGSIIVYLFAAMVGNSFANSKGLDNSTVIPLQLSNLTAVNLPNGFQMKFRLEVSDPHARNYLQAMPNQLTANYVTHPKDSPVGTWVRYSNSGLLGCDLKSEFIEAMSRKDVAEYECNSTYADIKKWPTSANSNEALSINLASVHSSLIPLHQIVDTHMRDERGNLISFELPAMQDRSDLNRLLSSIDQSRVDPPPPRTPLNLDDINASLIINDESGSVYVKLTFNQVTESDFKKTKNLGLRLSKHLFNPTVQTEYVLTPEFDDNHHLYTKIPLSNAQLKSLIGAGSLYIETYDTNNQKAVDESKNDTFNDAMTSALLQKFSLSAQVINNPQTTYDNISGVNELYTNGMAASTVNFILKNNSDIPLDIHQFFQQNQELWALLTSEFQSGSYLKVYLPYVNTAGEINPSDYSLNDENPYGFRPYPNGNNVASQWSTGLKDNEEILLATRYLSLKQTVADNSLFSMCIKTSNDLFDSCSNDRAQDATMLAKAWNKLSYICPSPLHDWVVGSDVISAYYAFGSVGVCYLDGDDLLSNMYYVGPKSANEVEVSDCKKDGYYSVDKSAYHSVALYVVALKSETAKSFALNFTTDDLTLNLNPDKLEVIAQHTIPLMGNLNVTAYYSDLVPGGTLHNNSIIYAYASTPDISMLDDLFGSNSHVDFDPVTFCQFDIYGNKVCNSHTFGAVFD